MTHALEIDRVSLGYPQGGAVKIVLHDFDLAVRSGELVSLLGASGVGKSSLLRVLAGLKQALSGQVRLFGEPFSALDAVIREQMQTMLREIVRRHNTAAVMVTHDIDEALLVSDRIVLVGAGGRKAGEWQPETPFPRHGRLHDLSRLRGEIMQSLYHAQQDTQQAATVEFVI